MIPTYSISVAHASAFYTLFYNKDLLDIYGLPSVFELFENPPSKTERKELLNNSVNSVIEAEWKKEFKKNLP